ncbi:MAG: M23 family metallopeptidase [Bacilli bacterium]|nr:M23 family metallopeptidase [Bacilli bacterium]
MFDENDITTIKSKASKNKEEKSFISKYFTKVLCSIIFVLSSLIFINSSENNYLLYKKEVLTKNFPYSKINNWYVKYFGNVIETEKKEDVATMVFSNNLQYEKIEKVGDSERIVFGQKTIVESFSSGIVVFMGEKENLGYTIIIQGVDDVDIWYSNIKNSSIKLYDYIETNAVLGEVDDNLIVTIVKDNKYLGYEEYINQTKD